MPTEEPDIAWATRRLRRDLGNVIGIGKTGIATVEESSQFVIAEACQRKFEAEGCEIA